MSLFVTFEGPDGAGKSTQAQLVAALLIAEGQEVLVTREPGGTQLGERVRTLLLDPGEYAIVPRAEALLMTAARSQHVDEVIEPALSGGTIVLCDRFVDSTLAYQGAGRGVPVAELRSLQAFAVGDLQPDLTVLLDLPAEFGIRRRQDSGSPLNRLDQDDIAFHQRVRQWYVREARNDPSRWLILDATREPDDLASEIALRIVDQVRQLGQNADANRMSE